MTAAEYISYIDAIEPNAYTEAQKLRWLSECEGKVFTGLFLVQPYEFTPVTEGSRILALPAPYDRVYPRYLQAMIHYANGEYNRYANSMAEFNEVWGELNRWFGGDYDVTDRLRNRKIVTEIHLATKEQTILTIPEGCALTAGRITVQSEATYQNSQWISPEAMPAGVYNIKADREWYRFTTEADYAPGTMVAYVEELPVISVFPDGSEEAHLPLSTGRDPSGTDIRIEEPTTVSVNGEAITSFRADDRGSTMLPMLLADYGGAEINLSRMRATSWHDDGKIVFSGRLLIPDERWSYEDKYARGRDARWQS